MTKDRRGMLMLIRGELESEARGGETVNELMNVYNYNEGWKTRQ